MSFSELPRESWRFVFTPFESIMKPGPGGFRASSLIAEAVGSFRHIASFYKKAHLHITARFHHDTTLPCYPNIGIFYNE